MNWYQALKWLLLCSLLEFQSLHRKRDIGIDISFLKVHWSLFVNFMQGFLERAGITNWKMGLRWKVIQKAAAQRSMEVSKLSCGIILFLAHFHSQLTATEKHWQLSYTHLHWAPPACVAPAEIWFLLERHNPLKKKEANCCLYYNEITLFINSIPTAICFGGTKHLQ